MALLGLLIALGRIVFAQAAETQVLFRDDFEDGDAGGWELQPGWTVGLDGGNHVLLARGGNQWTGIKPVASGEWRIVSGLETRLKRLKGRAQMNLRLGSRGTRYILGINDNLLELMKSSLKDPGPAQFTYEQLASVDLSIGTAWHTFKISADGNHVRVHVDGKLRLDYVDRTDPHFEGTVSLEAAPDSVLYFDDVVVTGERDAGLVTEAQPAGEHVWKRLGGPRGGIGYDVKIHPDNPEIIYVTDSNAGVHWSTDGGDTWSPMNEGITARAGPGGDSVPIFSLTIDRRHPEVIWVGTQGMKGVYKSVDGGRTWVEMDNGIENRPVMEIRSFTVDPVDSDVVYLGGNYSPDPSNNLIVKGFIYKTTDGGRNWSKILDAGALVRWIIVDPTDTDIVYASTGIFDRLAVKPEGVLKSTDGGRTWRNVNNGISNYAAVSGLVMHPGDPRILYACTGKWPPFYDSREDLRGAAYKTVDGGESWVRVYDQDSPDAITTCSLNPADPETVYATPGGRFARTTDGGTTWTETRGGPPNDSPGGPIAIAVHPDRPRTVFIDAYAGGVFRSTDGGTTWHDASKGYSGAIVYDLVIPEAGNPYRVIAATHNGIYESNDGGVTWEAHNNPRPGSTPFSIAANPINGDELLLGDRIDWAIRKSKDGGGRFEDVLGPLNDGRLELERMANEIAYTPSDPGIVFAGFSLGPHGDTKSLKPGPGIYKSTDGGEHWNLKNGGLEDTTLNILSVAVHPAKPDTVYIGTLHNGLYKSVDGGDKWFKSGSGLNAKAVSSIAVDPQDPDTVYAGAEPGGVFKSVDGGGSWRPVSKGVPYESSISSIAVDPADSQTIYAGDFHSGVYLSKNGGESWVKINEGLSHRAVTALAISSGGEVVYAATYGGGVFRLGGLPPRAAAPAEAAEPAAGTPRGDKTPSEETPNTPLVQRIPIPENTPSASAPESFSDASKPAVQPEPVAGDGEGGGSGTSSSSGTSRQSGTIRPYVIVSLLILVLSGWASWRWYRRRGVRREG